MPLTLRRIRSKPVATVPGDIDATGSSNVAAALTAWLVSLPAKTIADLGGGTFRCDTKVQLDDRVGLVIRNGTIMRNQDPPVFTPTTNFPEPLLWFKRPRDCHVEGMHFQDTNTGSDSGDGGHPDFPKYVATRELETAVRFDEFQSCSVVSCTANHIYGDGVQWQVGDGGITKDCVFDRIGRQGVTLIGSNLLADNTDVLHGRRSGYDIEPDSPDQAVGNIEIRYASTYTLGLPVASGGRGRIDGVYIHHNTWTGSSVPVVYCKDSTPSGSLRRANWRVEDNTLVNYVGSPQPAVYMVAVDGVSVKRNVLPVVSTQSKLGVGMEKCGGLCEIVDNNFGDGDRYYNVTPEPGQTVVVSGNTPSLVLGTP